MGEQDYAGRSQYLLRCGAVHVGPGASMSAHTKVFRDDVAGIFLRVIGVIACAWLLGGLIAQPPERHAWEHMTRADQKSHAAWTNSDVLYWTLTTVTTTGYGDVTPVTTTGRIIGMIDMVAGYVGLGLLIGYVAGRALAYQKLKSEYFERLLDAHPDVIRLDP
jgi:hypothetical protein